MGWDETVENLVPGPLFTTSVDFDDSPLSSASLSPRFIQPLLTASHESQTHPCLPVPPGIEQKGTHLQMPGEQEGEKIGNEREVAFILKVFFSLVEFRFGHHVFKIKFCLLLGLEKNKVLNYLV